MAQGYQKYSQAYRKSAINTIDQRKLIVMLYDGAIKFLTMAGNKQREGDFYNAHENLIKGRSIIAELLASLNLEKGGEIATNLQRVYAYMFDQLIEANVEKKPEKIESVVSLLKELREAWVELQPPKDKPGAGAPSGKDDSGKPKINIQG